MITEILENAISSLKETMVALGWRDGDSISDYGCSTPFFSATMEKSLPQKGDYVIWDYVPVSNLDYADNLEKVARVTFEVELITGSRAYSKKWSSFLNSAESAFAGDGWAVTYNGTERSQETKRTAISINVSKVFSGKNG